MSTWTDLNGVDVVRVWIDLECRMNPTIYLSAVLDDGNIGVLQYFGEGKGHYLTKIEVQKLPDVPTGPYFSLSHEEHGYLVFLSHTKETIIRLDPLWNCLYQFPGNFQTALPLSPKLAFSQLKYMRALDYF